MFTPRKLSILGLTLCAAMAGVTVPGLATRVSAAPVTPSIKVAAQDSTVYLSMPAPDETFRTITMHLLTLDITGSGFTPGSKVGIAVVHSSPWQLLAKGSTHAQRAVTTWVCGHEYQVCSARNPRAGTIDYRVRLINAPPASTLVVLYRSAGRTGMHDLALGEQ
jgi:hypothetical protein